MRMLSLLAALSFSCVWPAVAAPKSKKAPAPAKTPVAVSSAAALGLPLHPATTAEITVPFVLERFERFDRELDSLSMGFRQFVRWEESGVTQSVEGSLDYKKKDRLHLVHKLPEKQTLVGDGTWLWIWRQSTNQVIRTKLQDWKKSEPLAQGLMDFGSYAELLKRYDAQVSSVSAPGEDGHRRVELTLKPREKGADFTLKLRLTTRDFFPADAELRAGQIEVHSLFEDIRYNPALPDELFRFTPPAGADVFTNLKTPASP